jgi:formate hydrogenlyase transcriptional activator
MLTVNSQSDAEIYGALFALSKSISGYNDIPHPVRHFVQRCASRMNRVIDSIPTAAIEALARYDWPGNIRELQNVMERSVILTHGKTLTIAMPEILSHNGTAQRDGSEVMLNAERERILRALKQSKGVVGGPKGAAASLGLKRITLQSRIRKLNISRGYN